MEDNKGLQFKVPEVMNNSNTDFFIVLWCSARNINTVLETPCSPGMAVRPLDSVSKYLGPFLASKGISNKT